jgi:uncharacterized protein (DUF1778 family)
MRDAAINLRTLPQQRNLIDQAAKLTVASPADIAPAFDRAIAAVQMRYPSTS